MKKVGKTRQDRSSKWAKFKRRLAIRLEQPPQQPAPSKPPPPPTP
jgi:hypothetical protein